jgi:hypothetical protein
MIPIILYIDKTQLSLSGKLSIYPVQMSLGIFTEKVRISPTEVPKLLWMFNSLFFTRLAEVQMRGALLALFPMKVFFFPIKNAMNLVPISKVIASISSLTKYWNLLKPRRSQEPLRAFL